MLELLLTMSSNAILVFDQTGKILRANQPAADMFGLSMAGLQRLDLNSLISQHDNGKYIQLLESFLRNQDSNLNLSAHHQILVRHHSGIDFQVDLAMGRGIWEGMPIWVASLQDVITESHTEAYVRSLARIPLENPNPTFRVQDTGEILFINPSGELLLRELGMGNTKQAPMAWMGLIKYALEGNIQVHEVLQHFEKRYSYVAAPVKEMGYVNIFALDVTEREVEKDRLALSNDILDSIRNLVLVANSHAEVIYVSPSVKNIIGYEPEELLGNGWWEMERISGGDVEMEKDYIRWVAAGLATADVKPYEHRIRHKDGSWRWLMLEDAKGPRDLAIGIGTDITQLKKSEEALKESEARSRLAINAMDAVPYNLSYVEDRFTFIGQEVERITGYLPTELTPQKWTEILQEAHMRGKYEGLSLAEATRRVRAGDAEGIWQCDFRIVTKSGGICWISDRSVQVQDEDGHVAGSIGIFQDITDRKQVEIQLRAYADEIQAKNSDLAVARDRALESSYVKSAFLATMSHEIRTPMNAILGMTELLLDTDLNDEQRDFARAVESSTQHLLGILNDILDFSKIEAGKLIIRLSPFNPFTLGDELLRLFLPRAQEKDIQLTLSVASDLPEELTGDSGRIRQVLSNFISNAIKFTRQNGSVCIKISGTRLDHGIFMVSFMVEDTGVGVPDSLRMNMFEPFTQGDNSSTRQYGGTGLGLAISKRLVELMNGDIGFSSVEHQGSQFWFSLPLNVSANQSDPPTSKPAHYPDYSLHKPILIADDNSINRDLMTMQLRRFGIHSKHADNGQQAVELLHMQPENYSMVFMDIHMPVMDGLTATRLIRQMETGSAYHIPIIAITADVSEPIRDSCCRAGMDDFVSKPIALNDIQNLLSKWLQQPAQESPEKPRTEA